MGKLKSKFRNLTNAMGLTFTPEDEENDSLLFDENEIETETMETPEKMETVVEEPVEEILPENEEGCDTIFVNPTDFSDVKKIATFIDKNKLITLNLKNLNKLDGQRTLDYLSGAIKIKNAKWVTIGKNVYTIVPRRTKFVFDGNKNHEETSFINADY